MTRALAAFLLVATADRWLGETFPGFAAEGAVPLRAQPPREYTRAP